MKKLYLINGKPGTGKTSVAEGLFGLLEKVAILDVDDLIKVKPWEFNDELSLLGVSNASSVVNNLFASG